MKDLKIKIILKKKINKLQNQNEYLTDKYLKSVFILYNTKYIYNIKIDNYIFNNFYKSYTNYFNYIYEIELLYDTNIRGKFSFKYKFSYITSFITFLIKNGKKLNIYNNFMNCMSNIYYIFNNDYNNILQNYLYIDQFYLFLQKTENKFNLNFLLYWIVINYKPSFDIKCHNLTNHIKSKIKKKYKYKLLYIPEKIRIKISLSHLSSAIKKNDMSRLYYRINNTILDTLLNFKKSYLHTRKMYIYSKVFKI